MECGGRMRLLGLHWSRSCADIFILNQHWVDQLVVMTYDNYRHNIYHIPYRFIINNKSISTYFS